MWTMTEDMRRIAETRIIADRVTLASATEIKTSIWQGLKMSLRDYKLWIIILINVTISAAYGFSNFYPAIVRGFGYYTGAVFQVYDPAHGVPLGSGGRYDELLGRFGRSLPAVGFALNVERLHIALAGEERGEGR